MVVDDSAVIRGLLTRSLEADPEVEVLASASNGEMALSALSRHDIEIVILDIEMPVMDGLTALPKLLAAKPGLKVIIASTLTRRGADISMKALAAGAADYLTKPGASALTSADQFKQELLRKVKALGQARRRAVGLAAPQPAARGAAEPAFEPAHDAHEAQRRVIALRLGAREVPEIVAIGSSTGGPQALFHVTSALKGAVKQPIFITQHMPATFTTILAEHLARASGYPAAEGVDGEPVRGGRIYVAPGDFHMTVQAERGEKVVRLTKTPPENFCRPSVDPMLRSLAAAYGARVLTLILTGMGHDGLAGGRAVVEAGGTVIAQDEASSVVWGMPGSVAMAGLCSAVLPLDEIGPFVGKLAMRAGR
ncbi:MAG TPA: chemotaxis response regulator protein-glutamate methylesterase [Stellaceae bacterium]|nr:chemotaxis response regulator protein-glutamate methylesterase [Stellaceae bacterium]